MLSFLWFAVYCNVLYSTVSKYWTVPKHFIHTQYVCLIQNLTLVAGGSICTRLHQPFQGNECGKMETKKILRIEQDRSYVSEVSSSDVNTTKMRFSTLN